MDGAIKHSEQAGVSTMMMKDTKSPNKEIKMGNCEEYTVALFFYVNSGSNLSYSAYSGKESWIHSKAS